MVMEKGYVIGIAGGSGSGKTYLVNALSKIVGSEKCELISQDDYYIDRSGIENFSQINFDHPNSIDFEMVTSHIRELKNGNEVHRPTYDFKTHTRTDKFKVIKANRIILLDGTLIFTQEELMELIDCKIFVNTKEDLRLKRRIERDTVERGRSTASVLEQWNNQVEPMFHQYIEKGLNLADYVFSEQENLDAFIHEITMNIQNAENLLD